MFARVTQVLVAEAGSEGTVFGKGDALGVGLVITIIAAAVAMQRIMHKRAVEDTERHHDLDKRMTLMETSDDFKPLLVRLLAIFERREQRELREQDSGRSGSYKRTDDRGH